MQEASLSEVLRVLLIVLLIYFGFKLFIRWFGPIILRYFLKKVGKKFEQRFSQFGPMAGQQQQQKQGEITIDKKPEKKRKSKNDVGDYIDYEEID